MSMKLITVLIVAHNRKEFVLEAVRSVLSQDYDRRGFEVIVVKNFKDDKIDLFLQENGVITILSDAKNLSNKQAVGIENAHGDIICFLDDDDLFESQKLKVISEYFRNYDNLSFFHNGILFIDLEGKIQDKSPEKGKIIFDPIECTTSGIKKLVNLLSTYNCSSISVSGDIARKYSSILDKTTQDSDTFWFLSALDYGKPMISSSEYLTRYRRHTSGISRSYDFKKVSSYANSAYRNMIIMHSIFNSRCSKAFLKFKTVEWEIKMGIFDDDFKGFGKHYGLFLRIIVNMPLVPIREIVKLSSIIYASFYSKKFAKLLYSIFYV